MRPHYSRVGTARLLNRMMSTEPLPIKVIQLPETKPLDDPEALWALQVDLLSMAESVLGRRDLSKKIYQPQFSDDGPCIRNTPNLDGAFTELSRAGERYWPAVVFEMAHETVHLLDPVPGSTNNLEEGVAVAFSLHVQPSFGVCLQSSIPSYICAYQLVCNLPGGPLRAAGRVRNRFDALNDITVQDLMGLFPSVGESVLGRLAERFTRTVGQAHLSQLSDVSKELTEDRSSGES